MQQLKIFSLNNHVSFLCEHCYNFAGILLCVVIDGQDTTFPHPIGMWKMDNVHLEKDVTGNENHMEITSDVVASTDSPFEYYGSGECQS